MLAAVGLTGLAWAPVRAPEAGWGSAEVLATLAAGIVFVAAFLRWEHKGARYPMLSLAHFRNRRFSTANAAAFLGFASLIGALFMMTQFFQTGLGYDPLESGVRILVWNATPLLISPIAGALADRYGTRPFMLAGLLLQGIGLALLAWQVEPGVGYGSLVGPLIVAGVGISMVFPSVANAVTSAVPLGDAGVAAGVNNALRELGGVFGVAVAAAVFTTYGGYGSRTDFLDGCGPALWAAAGIAGGRCRRGGVRAVPGRRGVSLPCRRDMGALCQQVPHGLGGTDGRGAAAVVEQHVQRVDPPGQGAQPGQPLGEFGLLVLVPEPVLLAPRAPGRAAAVEADHGQPP